MEKEELTGLYFLEKTSYCDQKKAKYGGYVWALLSWMSFVCIVISSIAIFFYGLSLSVNLAGIGAIVAVLSLVLWVLSAKKVYFFACTGVVSLLTLIYGWIVRNAMIKGFHSIIDRGELLITDYMSGIVDSGTLQGSVGFETCMVISVILTLIICVCCILLKGTWFAVIPGVFAVIGSFFIGKVPNIPWFITFIAASCMFMALTGIFTHHGKQAFISAFGRNLYIRGEKNTVLNIGSKSGLMMVLLLVVGGSLGGLLSLGIGLPEKDKLTAYQVEVVEWMNEHFSFLNGWRSGRHVAEGGISGGNLADAGDRYYYGDVHLTVTSEIRPEATVYLKGYVGDNYSGSRWNSTEGGAYKAFAASNHYTATDENHIRGMEYELLREFGSSDMIVRKEAAFGEYEIFPYGVRGGDDGLWVNDLYIRGDSHEKRYEYAPLIYPLSTNYDDLALRGQMYLEENAYYKSLENNYRNFVYDHYTQVPQDVSELISGLDMGNTPDGLKAKLRYVRAFLADHYEYSLTPGDLPEGKDFVEYFLMENKQGYCMHFATAAVLMLRNMGVPARYAEGYLMIPGSFEPSEDGYTSVVYDHQAHAWTEIYLDGVGWIPVEMTPGFYDSSSLNELPEESEMLSDSMDYSETADETDLSETESEDTDALESETMETESEDTDSLESETMETESNETVKETESNGDETQTSEAELSETEKQHSETKTEFNESQSDQTGANADDANNGSKGESQSENDPQTNSGIMKYLKTILLVLSILAAVIIIAFVTIIVRCRYIDQKRRQAIFQKDASKGFIAAYNEMLELFDVLGFKRATYSDRLKLFEAVADAYEGIDADALENFEELTVKAAFSKDGVTAEQRNEGCKLYRKIRKELMARQKPWKRFMIKYIYCR